MAKPRFLRAIASAAHDIALAMVWGHAHRLRALRAAARGRSAAGKVLHVTTSFDVGGTQKQIQYLATSSAARFRHEAVEIFPELNFLYRRNVTVDPARYGGSGLLGKTVGRAVASRDRRGWQLLQVYKLMRDFEAERPQVVVGWGHEICATTFVAATLARVPHIVFCIRTVNPARGWTSVRFAARLLAAHRRMTPHVDRIIVNSSFLQRDHASWLGIAAASVAVCPNGVVTDIPPTADIVRARARMRHQLGIPDDAVVVVNVGRFAAEKGQMSLLAANRLLGQRPGGAPIVWLLCGDGPTLSTVRAAASAEGMTNVIFTGRTDAVVGVLAASDVFVMPSDYEGMPNAMMEAMAMGLPCVSTTPTGARDIARDGVEALFYEPGDVATLVEHLRSLVSNSERARSMGAAAQARVREFDVTRAVERFEVILDELPCERNGGRVAREEVV